MTKKDYKALAEMIARHNNETVGSDRFTALPLDTLCYWLATTNPRFDRERFLTACKGGSASE